MSATDHPCRRRACISTCVSPDCKSGTSCCGVGCDNPKPRRGPPCAHDLTAPALPELLRFRDQECSNFVIANTFPAPEPFHRRAKGSSAGGSRLREPTLPPERQLK